ncbi:E3 ubiquitin-protein ligase [Canna indica]|uniref:HECT-type E3 ubiquitin transferase n=1 Tax=Canna indica TaxID=4628 RepID=A0AAQ3QHP8_9LILI|nr:E3 ubiquitin-protein ligase [Canna indica]
METRSRKRAEASSSAPSSQTPTARRPSKRARTNPPPPSTIVTRSRRSRNLPASPPPPPTSSAPMDSAGDSAGRRRGAGKSHQPAAESDGDKDAPEKGKEREPEASRSRDRNRDRYAERILGADDDNDIDGGAGGLHQNLSSASSALQGLLRKLGAGFDDLLPSSALSAASSSQQSSRLKEILSGLRADGEEGRQVEALTQLCEMLSIGTEDSLGSFSVDSFVPVLVGLLNHDSNPDIMLLAARALTHLCDVLPSSCSAVVHYGAVPCFCARLLTIEYMDLAEQSLQALKKISQEHPTACLRAGALMAVLSYLDFFSTGVQRVALSTAANMCKKLPSDAADFVMDAVPLLTNLLNYQDSKVLEHASVCLTRIAEAFALCPEKLDELCKHGLVAQAAGLISLSNSGGQASLSPSTYTGLIHLLSTCASGSPLAAKTLLLLGISSTIKDILSGSALVSGVAGFPVLTRPTDQIFEIVNLVDELLPPLPPGTISLPIYSTAKLPSIKRSSSITPGKPDENLTINEFSAHEKLLQDQPELLQQFGIDLLPVLTQVYASSVNTPVRHKCLAIIGKLMYFSSADVIQCLLNATNISSFLAGILTFKDPQVLIPALEISEVLMEKLPETFSKIFVREGVIHAVDALICPDTSNSQASISDKDCEPGISSRSRRYRRRSGGLNTETRSTYELKCPLPVGSPPDRFEIPPPNPSLRAAVSARAKSFKDKYFPAYPGGTEVTVTDDLLRLKNLCTNLNSHIENVKTKGKGKAKASVAFSFDISSSTEEHLDGIVAELLAELSKDDGVSTFEFIGSGVILALLNYLSCGTFEKEKISEGTLPKLRKQALRRYRSFVAAALPVESKIGHATPMTMLVQKLQNALTSMERFPVVLSLSSSTGVGTHLSSGLSALSQPIKLRFCRASGEKSLPDYSSNIVLINPMATLAHVEDFIWPRVQRSDFGQRSSASAGNSDSPAAASGSLASPPSASVPCHRPSTRSRSSIAIGAPRRNDSTQGCSNSAKGKGKAVVKSTPEEIRGPQTRKSARRRAASDKNLELKPSQRGSASEDEMDMSPAEIDTLMIEEDVSDDEDDDHEELQDLPLCAPEKVHDVKLDPADDAPVSSANDDQAQPSSGSNDRTISTKVSEPSDLRDGNSFGSREAMSFAATAVAGLASLNDRGVRGGRQYHRLASGSSDNSNKLIFTTGGKQLNKHWTVYQAFQRQVHDEDDDESRFLGDILTITYQKADCQAYRTSQGGTTSMSKSSKSASASNSGHGNRWQQKSILDSILQADLPCDLEKTNPTYNILALLHVLECLNQLAPRLRLQAVCDDFAEGRIASLDGLYRTGAKVPSEGFVNSKLTPKFTRQIQDVLALFSGSIPSWCYQMSKACPFLFPFESRRQYFYSTSFGLSRALDRLQLQQNADNANSAIGREVRIIRPQRQKVRVARNRILESAMKVMEIYSGQKTVLEVEYFGEVGSGLGPTLEFYTLLSHDLQKIELGLWRSDFASDNSATQSNRDVTEDRKADNGPAVKTDGGNLSLGRRNLVQAPLGLFPRPWSPYVSASESSKFAKVLDYFRLVGRTMAKALQDGRLLDLPLSTTFYKLVLGQELDLYDILSFDVEFGKTLQEMQALVLRKQFLDATSGNSQKGTADLCFHGAPIEDLCLDFTLPGYPDYRLKEGEDSTMVNINNLEEYISLIVDATVKTGIRRQMDAFRTGFDQVFDIASLQVFSPQELDCLLCGRGELWKAETLIDHIKFDHGYTSKSPVIVNLLEIMGEFTAEQQRAFCRFVTGAPRLPPGGLAALNPKLTIVKKHSSTSSNRPSNGTGVSETADDDLPSVMTCANYLKLPPYSTKEILYKKLLYAISEGQGSFDLS